MLGNIPAGAGTIPALNAPGTISILKANSGASAVTSASDLDTIAISGLTAKDRILVIATLGAVTNGSNGAHIYSTTDSKVIQDITQTAPAAGNVTGAVFILGQEQDIATNIYVMGLNNNTGITKGGTGGAGTTGQIRSNSVAMTTSWQGSWTMSFRSDGVGAGGSEKWSWLVYKLAGQ